MGNVTRTYSLNEQTVQRLENYCKKSGIKKGKVVEFSLNEYLDKREGIENGSNDSKSIG